MYPAPNPQSCVSPPLPCPPALPGPPARLPPGFNAQQLLSASKGRPVPAVVDAVLNGSTLRVYLPDRKQYATVVLAGVQAPSLGRRVRARKEGPGAGGGGEVGGRRGRGATGWSAFCLWRGQGGLGGALRGRGGGTSAGGCCQGGQGGAPPGMADVATAGGNEGLHVAAGGSGRRLCCFLSRLSCLYRTLGARWPPPVVHPLSLASH